MIANSGGLVADYGLSKPNDCFFRQTLRYQPKQVLPTHTSRAKSVMGGADLSEYQNWPTQHQVHILKSNSKISHDVTRRLQASPDRYNMKRSQMVSSSRQNNSRVIRI